MNTPRLTLLLGLALSACGAAEKAEPVIQTGVIRGLAFGREEPAGVSIGMNLDGYVSDDRDDRSCQKVDFTDPSGAPGVDNELGRLLPLVDLAGEGALEALIQGAIDEGRLLVLIDVVDSGEDGIELVARRGEDTPILGTDGKILSGQTFLLHAEPELGRAHAQRSDDGVLTSEPFALELPVIVFSLLYVVKIPSAVMRLRVTEDGSFVDGLIAGGIPISQLEAILVQASEFGGDFDGLFGDALRASGDLDRDPSTGACRATSVAVRFDATPAFTF